MTEANAAISNHSAPTETSKAALIPESGEQFRLVLEASLDGFIILRSVRNAAGTIADFLIEYTNPVAARNVNRTPAELVSQYLLELFPDCKTSGIFDRYVRVAESGTSDTFETFYKSQNLTGWYRNVVVKLNDGIAVSFSNITDRKQAELALQQQEQHFKIALQAAKLGSWEHDLITGVLTCSAQCKANFGLPPDAEFTHETLFAALHPNDRPLVQAAIQRCIQERTDYEVEERCYHPDGSLHWLIVQGQLVYDASGTPVRLVGITLDITERKQLEESLKATNQHISSILESITDAFVTFDRDWRYTYVNQEAARLLERSPQELLGQRWQDVFPEIDRQDTVIGRALQQAMTERVTVRLEEFSLTLQRWVEMSVFPSADGIAVSFRDISNRKRAEQRRDVQYAIARILAEATTVAEATPVILQALCENLDWQVGVLWGVALDRSLLHYVNSWQSPDLDIHEFLETAQQMTFAQNLGLPGQVWSTHQPIWFSRLNQDENFPRATLADQAGLQSAFGFPIQLGDEILGVIECFSNRIQEPDTDLLQMMAAIGNQIGQFMERQRTETALRQREVELRLVTNAVPVLISFIDTEQRYRFTNQKYEEWFGQPAEEVSGKHLWEVLGELAYKIIRPYVEQVLAGHEVTFESKIPYQARGNRDVIVTYVPRFNLQRKVEGFVALVTDITRRKQAEETLRQSEERLRIAQQAANAGVWNWDITANHVTWSEEYYRLYGLDPATIQPSYENWLSSIIEQDRDRVDQAAREALERQVDVNVEFRILHPIQGERWLTAIGQTFYDDNKQPKRMTGIALDITDRKQAEAALRHSEERYRYLVESIPQLVWTADAEGMLTDVNQRWSDFTGLTLAQAQTKGWQAIVHPDDVSILSQNWIVAQQNGTYYQAEGRMRRVDGVYRWHLHQAIPLKNEQGQPIKWFGTATDIEEQKQLEQQRIHLLQQEQAAREQAEAANRIKDEFLAVLSHELRSPLNPILGWAKLLRTRKLDETTVERALETIERNASLQTQLIGDLLDVSRILQGKLSLTIVPVDLVATITAAMETVRLAAEAKSIRIQTFLNGKIEPIAGDGARLQQIIWNLLSNAVKFTPEGGRVTIQLQRVGSHAQITISDTGKGISPEFLPYVFDYFRQADSATTRNFGGLGLGLAIVRYLAELHGGTVKAESAGEGQGATFTVCLPLMKDKAELKNQNSVDVSTASQPSPRLMGLQILIVDDDLDTRNYLTFVLEQAGASVTVAASADEALQALMHSTPNLLLSDIGMPEMDGYTLMRQIRALPQGTQMMAIALTAYAGEMNQQQAIAAGFQQHLAKPVEPEILLQTIISLCAANPAPEIRTE